jgi:hypothetical protein
MDSNVVRFINGGIPIWNARELRKQALQRLATTIDEVDLLELSKMEAQIRQEQIKVGN